MEFQIVKIITSYNLQQFREMFHNYRHTLGHSTVLQSYLVKVINTDRL